MPWTFYNASGQKLSSKGKVPVADLANGTDGELITWGTDATATVVAAGSSGQILTSGGAGAVPSFQTASSGPSQADQAALEGETDEDTYAPPDLMKHHPGVVKSWVSIIADGTRQSPYYNVATVTDSGTGNRVINFTVDHSSIIYTTLDSIREDGTEGHKMNTDTFAVGSYRIICRLANDAFVDIAHGSATLGDQ